MRALLLVLAACSAATATRPPAKAPVVARATPPPCPLELDGASVAVKDVDQGVALEFTSYEDVAELRRQVRLLADTRDAATNHRLLANVDGGVQIIFPADLKSQVIALAQQMDGVACPTALPTTPDERVVAR
jgi:hypothetical protein